jgi:hypothetical protein
MLCDSIEVDVVVKDTQAGDRKSEPSMAWSHSVRIAA